MIGAPLFAHLSQFFNPLWLVLSGMSLFTVACFIAGFSQGFVMIFIARMMSGVGDAGLVAIAPVIFKTSPQRAKTCFGLVATWLQRQLA